MHHTKEKLNSELFRIRLNLIKELKGLNNKDLAVYFGVTDQVINNFLIGRTTPKPPVIEKYVAALGLNYDWVIGLVDEPMYFEGVADKFIEYGASSKLENIPPAVMAASHLINANIFAQIKSLSDRLAILELELKQMKIKK